MLTADNIRFNLNLGEDVDYQKIAHFINGYTHTEEQVIADLRAQLAQRDVIDLPSDWEIRREEDGTWLLSTPVDPWSSHETLAEAIEEYVNQRIRSNEDAELGRLVRKMAPSTELRSNIGDDSPFGKWAVRRDGWLIGTGDTPDEALRRAKERGGLYE